MIGRWSTLEHLIVSIKVHRFVTKIRLQLLVMFFSLFYLLMLLMLNWFLTILSLPFIVNTTLILPVVGSCTDSLNFVSLIVFRS